MIIKQKGIYCILLVLALGWMGILPIAAQTKYKNKLTAELCTRLSSYDIPDNWTGECYIKELSAESPIIVQRDKRYIVNHVGLKLFDRQMMDKQSTPFFLFTERYLLELLLLKDEEDIRYKLKSERVSISSKVHDMSSYRKGIRAMLSSFSNDYSIFLTHRNNRGMLSCAHDGKHFFSMTFPLRYELITGDTKMEAESAIHSLFLDFAVNKEPSAEPLDLMEYKDSLYKSNEDYYITEPLVSTSYYYVGGNDTIPILSADYVAESVYNLFNARMDAPIKMEVTQKLYGSQTKSFTCPLPLFVEFIRSQGCNVYTSIRSANSSQIKGTVAAVNQELGYQHLIRFTLDKRLLTAPDKYVVKADMYSYIPIHNLSSMY